MLARRSLLALVSVVAVALPAFGQDQPASLKWKFEVNKAFYQEMTTTTKQTMKVMNSDVVQNQTQTFIFSWTPVKQENEGWVIKQKIEGVKMSIDIGGQAIKYDSTQDTNATNPLGDFFKQLVGSEFTLTLDKDMKVTKVEGRAEFIKKLVQANPQMEPLLNQILSEQALKEMADPTFAAVPNADKKKGDSWEKDSKLDMGPIGTYENKYKYTYDGKNTEGTSDQDKKLDKIKVETTLKYTPPGDAAANSPLPFKIKSADLTSKNATGTILFNADKGRIESSKQSLNLSGKLKIEIGGQATDVDLTQEQSTEVKTTDTNPVQKKTT